MSQHLRLRKIMDRLETGRCVPRDALLRDLEISRSTLTRDIACLRDRHGAPVRWLADQQGWRLERDGFGAGTQFEMVGMFFSAEESHALLMMIHLLTNLEADGLLGRQIDPLLKRVMRILGTAAPTSTDVASRIRLVTIATRKIAVPHYQSVASALLRRLRLVIDFHNRERDDRTKREVSPQRLVHYRDNWYLDAWCHMRHALRSFGVDAIRSVRVLDRTAIEVSNRELDETLGAGYGIFAGRDVRWAGLRFSAIRSRWVANETWHKQQRGRYDAEGRWLLDVPYSDPTELVMDVLRHIPEVEVLWPEELVEIVRLKLRAGLATFDGGAPSSATG